MLPKRFHNLLFACVLSAPLVFLAGCPSNKPIEVSTFPKPPELMLVGISVRGDTVWSIKLANAREKILAAEDSVYEFAQSFVFSSETADPTWTVPDNWKKLGKTTEFRIATFEIEDAEAESERTQILVSRIRMGRQDSSEGDKIVANINRWRKEMNAEEVINYTINEDDRAVERSAASLVIPFMKKLDVGGRPMYFDKIAGVYQKKSGPAPFMSAMGAAALKQASQKQKETSEKSNGSADNPSTSESKSSGKPNPNSNSSGTQTPTIEEQIASLPIEFDLPKDWKFAGIGSLVVVRFVVGEGDQQAEVKISQFPGSTEDVNWASTVSMWQRQFQAPVTPADGLEEITGQLSVGELSAKVVNISGVAGKAGSALQGAMIINSTTPAKNKWFVKILGSETTVKAQKANFESFVKSIRFKPVNKPAQ